MASVHAWYSALFDVLERDFTAVFSVEYIDLLALLPTDLAILVPGLQALIDGRLLRIFRVLKISADVAEFAARRVRHEPAMRSCHEA